MALLASRANGAVALRNAIRLGLDQGTRFVLPFGCVGEVWRVATEPAPGLAVPWLDVADFLDIWGRRGDVLLPGAIFLEVAGQLLSRIQPLGAAVFDVLIAALCIEHAVDEIWTLDGRFPRDSRLKVIDPLNP